MIDYDEVLEFAKKKHEGQFRADGVTPYINHPILVAEIVRKYKPSKNIDAILAAALLHDTLEDTYTSYRELVDNFGEMVASMVMEVTSASYMPHQVGKAEYLAKKMYAMSEYALVIKLADRLANIIDSKSLPSERREKINKDTIIILDYLEQNRRLTIPEQNIISEIRRLLNEKNERREYETDKIL